MKFDFPTMMVGLSFVTILMALLSFCSWTATRRNAFLPPLTCAFLLGSVGILVAGLRPAIPTFVSISAGNALILLAYGFGWKAVRAFEHRSLRPAGVTAPAALWLAACLYPPFYTDPAARVAVMSSLTSISAVLIVRELWRGRHEPLPSRWMAIVIGGLHALFMLVRVVLVHDLPFPLGAGPGDLNWAVALPLEGIAYSTLTLCSMLLMERERAELQQRRAANLDPLTGIANRRAFIEAAENIWFDQSLRKGTCVAILIFDLDRFKQINDTFGHKFGDDVLILFARTASKVLGPKAVFARFGGEEFAAALQCTNPEQAYRAAEQVRAGFAEAALCTDGLAVESTVSIGLSVMDHHASLSTALASADRALYRAKREGRNRVEFQEVHVLHPEAAA